MYICFQNPGELLATRVPAIENTYNQYFMDA